MISPTRLSLLFALTLVGCADNHMPGDDDGGRDPDPQQPDPERSVEVTGTYRLHSTFDIATNMPGSSGAFVNGLIAATDDPDDPMSWLLDQMISTLPNGTPKTVLQTAKPFVAGYLNDKLTQLAPELVGTVRDVGHRMADLTKNFGVAEKLAVTSSDQLLLGRITADGVRFKVDSNYVDAAFADHDIDDVIVDGVNVTYQNGHLGIGEHTLPLPYAKIVRVGLDVAIIPAIDPSAHDVADLLDDVVDCHGVGQGVADALGVGSAAFWESACHGGLAQAANLVYDQIAAADSSLDFQLTGNARAADSNDDYKLDKLSFGEWAGTLSYSGTVTPLAQPATFVGDRL